MKRIGFLWHMHQPCYQTTDGVFRMPWVFLHTIKDYFDMPYLAAQHNIKATFNITPTLINQINTYQKKKEKADLFLGLWMKEPIYLSEDERRFVVKICKSPPYKTMVKPLKRFDELYGQASYTDSELLDLEVVFMLAFCGNYLRENDAVVAELLQKGRGFSQTDKYRLMGSLLAFLPKVLNIYSDLAKQKKIGLSTTPFAHPILPLLIDASVARKADESIELPKNILSLKDDARLHVERAIGLFEETFGFKPKGLWPAEGAICKDSLMMYRDFSVEWVATDEDILKRSLGIQDRDCIYKAYEYNGVRIFFRDRYLSDGIGFRYHSMDIDAALSDFLSGLKSDGIAFVILDGENAWEYYDKNGKPFLEALYDKINESGIQTVLLDDVEALDSLDDIKPGSWIFSNFNTWIGDKQKNRAWELLFNTKRDYLRHKDKLKEETIKQAESLFLRSEASDWFWWYGKGHHSEHEAEFDSLFRENLIEIYRLMGIQPPPALLEPIVDESSLDALVVEPKNFICPVIDGKITSFFEWLGSGMINETATFSVMDTSLKPIHKLFYGQNDEWVFFRFDGNIDWLKRVAVIKVYCSCLKKPIKLRISKAIFNKYIQLATYEIVELAVSKTLMADSEVYFRFEFEIDGRVIQILPGLVELKVRLDRDFSYNWFV
ncbi:glycoside hydrolase family 57 protein [Hippea sp. KM1]|uniref:glycoside hydrolase family 57 protein n=1 Tax=Hippea sp. KM1 TaxID=944481 RepID=UPI00046C962B|nr:glycoside hydrolase family 57 protein [Hippea sp. KM1]